MHSMYGGSMKAFFVNDITLPFDNMRDVLKDFPSWNLVYIYGNSAFFTVYANQVPYWLYLFSVAALISFELKIEAISGS